MTISRDVLAPNFQIFLEKNAVSANIMKLMTSVVYEDNSDLIDKITIEISTQIVTAKGQTVTLLDSKLFTEGNLIEIFMGYGGSLNSIGAGEIVKIQPNFPRDTPPTLTITAYDILHRLSNNNKESSEGISYKKLSDSEIVKEIAKRNKLIITDRIVDTKGVHTRFQKKGRNDLQFLKELAKYNSYEMYVRFDSPNDEWILNFHPPKSEQEKIYTFKYNTDSTKDISTLLEFAPEMNINDQPVEVEFIGFDRKTNKKIKGVIQGDKKFTFNKDTKLYDFEKEDRKFKTNSTDVTESIDEPSSIKFRAFGVNREIISDESINSEKDAERIVNAWIEKRKQHFITGSGSVIGLETLQARQTHKLEGIGKSLSGDYFFTQVTHNMKNGSPYECSFACRKVVK